jgi:hypothetical protein
MPDTKDGRERQARDSDNRQRRREVVEAREREQEREPPQQCQYEECQAAAAFEVLERYPADENVVETMLWVCTDHAAMEGPTNLSGESYLFQITTID